MQANGDWGSAGGRCLRRPRCRGTRGSSVSPTAASGLGEGPQRSAEMLLLPQSPSRTQG